MAGEYLDAARSGVGREWLRGSAGLAVLIAFGTFVALAFAAANLSRQREAALQRERHSYQALFLVRDIDASIARSEAALGYFVLSGDRYRATTYYSEGRNADRQIDQLRQHLRRDPAQVRRAERLRQLYDRRLAELGAAATRTRFNQGLTGISLYDRTGRVSTGPQIRRALADIASTERDKLTQRLATTETLDERSNLFINLTSVFGLVLVLGIAALGAVALQAFRQRKISARLAELENRRARLLEAAVEARTAELSRANEAIRAEATERASAEAQLRQIQKMEAVGQLTGGIAHDFNNMLAVVIGSLDLAKRHLDRPDADPRRHLDNAMEGANRAAALTRRLLAFARNEPLLPEGIAPGRLIEGMADLFERTLGEGVHVETDLADDGWLVWVDAHQFENAVLNLAVNARDAMNDRGRLFISSRDVRLDDGEVGQAPAGDYVCVSVADTGSGMAPEVLERAFEPFFTTKPVGKGTGLGLSQIFGFVRRSGGDLRISSTLGEGTTVSLFLPRSVRAVRAGEAALPAPEPAGEQAADPRAILVVEDDPRVRAATVETLEDLGYLPTACESGALAMDALNAAPFALIVTDVVMPEMTGPEFVRAIAPRYGHIPVLYLTGYVGEAGDAEELAGHHLLRKPFTIAALAAAVERALGTGGRGTSESPAAPAALAAE